MIPLAAMGILACAVGLWAHYRWKRTDRELRAAQGRVARLIIALAHEQQARSARASHARQCQIAQGRALKAEMTRRLEVGA